MKYKIRTATDHEINHLPPRQALRQNCLECYAWQPDEVNHCQSIDCVLYPFRLGYKLDRSVGSG